MANKCLICLLELFLYFFCGGFYLLIPTVVIIVCWCAIIPAMVAVYIGTKLIATPFYILTSNGQQKTRKAYLNKVREAP